MTIVHSRIETKETKILIWIKKYIRAAHSDMRLRIGNFKIEILSIMKA